MRLFWVCVALIGGCASSVTGTGSLIGTTAEPLPPIPTTPLPEGVTSGMIDHSDAADRDGRLADGYTVDLLEGTWVRLWVSSGQIDGVLRVMGPQGNLQVFNDDFVPGQLDPLIEFQAPLTGQYEVRVISLVPGHTGPYQVGLMTLHPEAEQQLTLGNPASGMATPGGAGPGVMIGAGYWIQARGGERIRLRVTSQQIDTTAAVIAPTGQTWINDDANDTGPNGSERALDSTVQLIAPTSGYYHVIVSSFAGRTSGQFLVRSTSRPPVILAEGEVVPSMGYAGRNGEGRMLGLFAGISQYPEGRSNLYACADDATLLAQAFRERHLMSPAQQMVLTDINANRAAFLAGLHHLAATSTPQDVVVIFFSGHGGTEPQASQTDPDIDGTDETIVLYDGEMRDNELVALIDQIQADTIILALDSCHSGGFARDFLTRPNRIGLFSSDEDVLSDTAEPLLAGGYLSVTLRRSVMGLADFMPEDGVVFAGELTDSLQRQFVEHAGFINRQGSNEPMQWLVSRRGSVGWSDSLWTYPRGPDGELLPMPSLALDSPPARR